MDNGRFAFGRNWQQFLRVLDEERIHEAEKSLCDMLHIQDMSGKSLMWGRVAAFFAGRHASGCEPRPFS